MHSQIINLLCAALLLIPVAFATPVEEGRDAKPAAEAMHILDVIFARQVAPSSYTTSRTANTEFAPPPITQSSSSVEAVTSRVSNNQIVPSSVTGPDPPLVTTTSRTANNVIGPPVTPSSGLAAKATGAMRMDVVFGGVVLGVAGMV